MNESGGTDNSGGARTLVPPDPSYPLLWGWPVGVGPIQGGRCSPPPGSVLTGDPVRVAGGASDAPGLSILTADERAVIGSRC